MAFGSFDKNSAPAPMAEINMVPLIDVMLVLLVIFIVTAPMLSHAIKLDLPKTAAPSVPVDLKRIQLSLDASGALYWDDQPLSREEAAERMRRAAQVTPQPALHLRADRDTRYERIAQVLSDAGAAGLTQIGFMAQPPPPAPSSP